MDIRTTIELLLGRMNTRGQMVGGTFAALGGTAGSMQMLQKDANAAITLWNNSHDMSGLRSLTATLHAYGNLTDGEYAQIIQVLDGDN
jgi:hypothetical protein